MTRLAKEFLSINLGLVASRVDLVQCVVEFLNLGKCNIYLHSRHHGNLPPLSFHNLGEAGRLMIEIFHIYHILIDNHPLLEILPSESLIPLKWVLNFWPQRSFHRMFEPHSSPLLKFPPDMRYARARKERVHVIGR